MPETSLTISISVDATHQTTIVIPPPLVLLFAAAFDLVAINLDIMDKGLTESDPRLRAALRNLAEAAAPFGFRAASEQLQIMALGLLRGMGCIDDETVKKVLCAISAESLMIERIEPEKDEDEL